ncbi:MAG TPA: DsbA family protein [Acidimicrobiales bacterium]|nr:DsbA family protein [Acidimicrobiales bacterium]
MSVEFGLTWDYRCPFARNMAEHVVTALEHGADWRVTWVPFSLTQVHVAEGELDAWDDPAKASTLHAMEAAMVVRDRFPEQFLAVHRALFAARHDEGLDLRLPEVIDGVLTGHGVDAAAVAKEIESGWPRAEFRKAHTDAVDTHKVFGVPTFLVGDAAVFVRVMDRPGDDGDHARRTVERVLDAINGWPQLNEFKHTSISR